MKYEAQLYHLIKERIILEALIQSSLREIAKHDTWIQKHSDELSRLTDEHLINRYGVTAEKIEKISEEIKHALNK